MSPPTRRVVVVGTASRNGLGGGPRGGTEHGYSALDSAERAGVGQAGRQAGATHQGRLGALPRPGRRSEAALERARRKGAANWKQGKDGAGVGEEEGRQPGGRARVGESGPKLRLQDQRRPRSDVCVFSHAPGAAPTEQPPGRSRGPWMGRGALRSAAFWGGARAIPQGKLLSQQLHRLDFCLSGSSDGKRRRGSVREMGE